MDYRVKGFIPLFTSIVVAIGTTIVALNVGVISALGSEHIKQVSAIYGDTSDFIKLLMRVTIPLILVGLMLVIVLGVMDGKLCLKKCYEKRFIEE